MVACVFYYRFVTKGCCSDTAWNDVLNVTTASVFGVPAPSSSCSPTTVRLRARFSPLDRMESGQYLSHLRLRSWNRVWEQLQGWRRRRIHLGWDEGSARACSEAAQAGRASPEQLNGSVLKQTWLSAYSDPSGPDPRSAPPASWI